jgi:prepilin-type N-terminal cleavage/methylation domain-containing protein
MRRNQRADGFTLVEMLVVIGIMGIIAGSLLGTFGYVKTAAWQSRAQAQVSQAATALTIYLQNERSWPSELLNTTEFDQDACWFLQENKVMDVTPKKKILGTSPQQWEWNEAKGNSTFDRWGYLNPWGRAYLRKFPNAKEAQVKKFRLQYRLDKNFDGYVDASEGSPRGVKIRASVIVWSRGPDAEDDFKNRKRYPYDDRLSWDQAKASAE